MNLQLNQVKSTIQNQGLLRVNITLESFGVSVFFHFKAEFESNDIDSCCLVTQKNEKRFFKSIDSAYKLVSSLICPDKDLLVDVVIRSHL